MASCYGFKLWDVKRLTIKQLNLYLGNLRYAGNPWSEKYGNPPPKRIANPHIIELAEKCGIQIPEEIRSQIRHTLQIRPRTEVGSANREQNR